MRLLVSVTQLQQLMSHGQFLLHLFPAPQRIILKNGQAIISSFLLFFFFFLHAIGPVPSQVESWCVLCLPFEASDTDSFHLLDECVRLLQLAVFAFSFHLWWRANLASDRTLRALSLCLRSPGGACWIERLIKVCSNAPAADCPCFDIAWQRPGRTAVNGGVWGGQQLSWQLLSGTPYLLALS